MCKNFLHNNFKRICKNTKFWVQRNPYDLYGVELIVHPDGKIEKTENNFDEKFGKMLQILTIARLGIFQMQLSKAK